MIDFRKKNNMEKEEKKQQHGNDFFSKIINTVS